MSSRLWDPYQLLNLTSRDTTGMKCVGIARSRGLEARCRWDIDAETYTEVCDLLSNMETKPPNEALSKISKLARLCLCSEVHQNQRAEVTEKWKALVRTAGEEYEKIERLKRKNRASKTKLEETEKRYDECKGFSELAKTLLQDECDKVKAKSEVITEENAKLLERMEQYKSSMSGLRQEREALKTQLDASLVNEDYWSEQYRLCVFKSSLELSELKDQLAARTGQFNRELNFEKANVRYIARLLEGSKLQQRLDIEKVHQNAEEYRSAAEIFELGLQSELRHERQKAEEYKLAAEAEMEAQRITHANLRSELEAWHEMAKKDKKATEMEQENQLVIIRDLRLELETAHQLAEKYKSAAEQQNGQLLLTHNFDLELEKELQTAGEYGMAIALKMEGYPVVIRNLYSKLVTERQITAQRKESRESLIKELKNTRLSLTESRKTNQKLRDTAAAKERGLTAENSQLLKHISKLEKQLSTFIWSILYGRMNAWMRYGVYVQWFFRSRLGSWLFVRKDIVKRD